MDQALAVVEEDLGLFKKECAKKPGELAHLVFCFVRNSYFNPFALQRKCKLYRRSFTFFGVNRICPLMGFNEI
ncbi:hypothetical protein R0J90_13115 [Micrococcus sp. SIMBA_144]